MYPTSYFGAQRSILADTNISSRYASLTVSRELSFENLRIWRQGRAIGIIPFSGQIWKPNRISILSFGCRNSEKL